MFSVHTLVILFTIMFEKNLTILGQVRGVRKWLYSENKVRDPDLG